MKEAITIAPRRSPLIVAGVTIEYGDMVVIGGPRQNEPCLTCRHWNHIKGKELGFCLSDTPADTTDGALYTDANARRPCWEGMP